MPEGIRVRGPRQFRAQVRRSRVYQTKTFEKLSEAQEWQRGDDLSADYAANGYDRAPSKWIS